MLTIIQTSQQNLNNRFSKLINTIVIILVPQYNGRQRLNPRFPLDKIIRLYIFLFKEINDLLNLVVIFLIGISSHNDLQFFTGRLTLLLVS